MKKSFILFKVLIFYILFCQLSFAEKCPGGEKEINTPEGCIEYLEASRQRGPNCWAYAYSNMMDIYQRCTLGKQEKEAPKTNPWNLILYPEENKLKTQYNEKEKKRCEEKVLVPSVDIEGGHLEVAHELFKKTNLNCSLDEIALNYAELEKYINKIFEYSKNSKQLLAQNVFLVCKVAPVGADSFIGSLINFIDQFTRKSSKFTNRDGQFFLRSYLRDYCKKNQGESKLSPMPELENLLGPREKMQKEISESLEKNTPLGVEFCSMILTHSWRGNLVYGDSYKGTTIKENCGSVRNQVSCKPHASVITAQKNYYDPFLKKWQCFYKMKNSWGAECGGYHKSYTNNRWDLCTQEVNRPPLSPYQKNQKSYATTKAEKEEEKFTQKKCGNIEFCEAETGSVWVTADALMQNTLKLYKFK